MASVPCNLTAYQSPELYAHYTRPQLTPPSPLNFTPVRIACDRTTNSAAPQGFNKALGQIVSHGVTNSTRSFTRALTRSRWAGSDPAAHYASQLDRLTAAFAYCSDVALTMGGKIKVTGRTRSGRVSLGSRTTVASHAPRHDVVSLSEDDVYFFEIWVVAPGSRPCGAKCGACNFSAHDEGLKRRRFPF